MPIVTASAPDLAPKTWYGMPAYYRDGKVVCFFQPADKFKARYATFGFNDSAKLDDGGDVADLLGADEADGRRREEDRRAREEGGELMIASLQVTTIYVLDKDEALDFYVNKLGLEVGDDFKQGSYRWLTVRVPGDAVHRDLTRGARPAAP